MNEIQIKEILSSFRDAINAIIERIDAQDEMIKASVEKCDGLYNLVFDEVINPAKAALEESIYNTGLEEFTSKYGEKLGCYNDKLRPIEGEEFDVVKQAYDGYNQIEGEKPDEEVYIDELVKQIDVQLDEIRKALGVGPEAEVSIVDEGEGEPEVIVDGEPVDVSDEVKDEVKDEVSDTDDEADETEESDPDELKKLEEELLAYKK